MSAWEAPISRSLARELAAEYKTPLYVYSLDVVRDRIKSLRRAFKKKPLIFYAVKANPNRGVCAALAKEGAGAEIVSGGELVRALAAGFPPSRIIFSGIGKTQEEMAAALRAGIAMFNVESREELMALEKVAERLRRTAPVAIRLNPDVDAGTHPHVTTGRFENKFGVDEKEAEALCLHAARSRSLHARGLQCHIGSQIQTVKPYQRAVSAMASLIERLQSRGLNIDWIDVGGGLGVAYNKEKILNLREYARTLETAFARWPKSRLAIEPGRFLVADAGILLTSVLYRKKTPRRSFVIVDAAMNDLARPALYGAFHPIWSADGGKAGELVDVVGPVCESGDFLARQRRLPPQNSGNILAVGGAGAYGFAMSSQYNSRLRCAEVVIERGRAKLSRRRERISDLTAAEKKS